MTEQFTSTDRARRWLMKAISLLLVCSLAGFFSYVSMPFAVWVVRATSAPEEEEAYAKDRSALIQAAHPSKRGTIRPRLVSDRPARLVLTAEPGTSVNVLSTSTLRFLTGAGIYQIC